MAPSQKEPPTHPLANPPAYPRPNLVEEPVEEPVEVDLVEGRVEEPAAPWARPRPAWVHPLGSFLLIVDHQFVR